MDEQNVSSMSQQESSTQSALEEFSAYISSNLAESQTRLNKEVASHHRTQRIAERATLLIKEVQHLQDENRRLKDQLEEAHSQIFSLQPYIQDITPNEAGRAYEELTANIEHWVFKIMEPWTADAEAGIPRLLSSAAARPVSARQFAAAVHKYPDLVKASDYPDTEMDIVTALIWRSLKLYLLDSLFLRDVSDASKNIEFIRMALENHAEPKRSSVFVRNWRAEAYNGLLSHPRYQIEQEKHAQTLAKVISGIVGVFVQPGDEAVFESDCYENCVRPAVALHQKMLVSKDIIHLDLRNFCYTGSNGDFRTDGEFSNRIEYMECEDILNDRKKLAPGVVKSRLPKEEGKMELEVEDVCAVRPALIMQQASRHNTDEQTPKIVRQQTMIVAWGTRRQRNYTCRNKDTNCINELIFSD